MKMEDTKKKLRCERWCADCKALDCSYCTEKYVKDEGEALSLVNVSDSQQGEICQICHGEMDADYGNVCSECDDSHFDAV